MNHHNNKHRTNNMLPGNAALLQDLRSRRNFDPDLYIDAKTRAINANYDAA